MAQTPTEDATPEILIVDDSADSLQVLERFLKVKGYRVRPMSDGALALASALDKPPDLILLDITMPALNGYEVCRLFKANRDLRTIPILFLSGHEETEVKVKAFQSGGVDYITKPFQLEEVLSRVETHLKIRSLQIELEQHNRFLGDLVTAQMKEISASHLAAIFALAKLSESRDEDTGRHLERVQIYCRLLAQKLSEQPRYRDHIGSTYLENIYRASPLHDIGKVGIRDAILLKQGTLAPGEFEAMKIHTLLGAHTLEAVRDEYPKNAFINIGIAIARSHHERWDGSGYPNRISGDDIPLSARIMALADVYDALRSVRCYKQAFTRQKTAAIIHEGSGVHFDPGVVEAFEELNEKFEEIHATFL
jgi:putative two-component system response regulator